MIDNNNDKHYCLKVIIEYCIKWQPHDKERATDIQRPAHGLTDGEPVRYITCINRPAFKSAATKARHAKETPWPVIMRVMQDRKVPKLRSR